MKDRRLILENSAGQVARVFVLKDLDRFCVVYREDLRRIEICRDVKDLAADKVSFQILGETTLTQIEQTPLKLNQGINGGVLRLVSPHENLAIVPPVEVPEENSQQLRSSLKWSATAHVAVLSIILLLGYLLKPDTEMVSQVVTIVPQSELIKEKEVVPIVPMQEKIVRQKHFNKTVKNVTQVKLPRQSVRTNKKSLVAKQRGNLVEPNIKNMGALGVLGGFNKNSRGSGGINPNAIDPFGGKGSGNGAGARGGSVHALIGNGLIHAPAGDGTKGDGGGGYLTRGKAGGRPGYGKYNLIGGSGGGAYGDSLAEEPIVEAGLDQEQVAQVIFKHMGQITYCYEKGLQIKPELKGRVSVRWLINPHGRVTTSRIATSSLSAPMVETCMLKYLNTWQFPRPQGGVSVSVTYPFVLRRVSQR